MSKYQAVKNNKGFTLVEVIVVAVIVLILAAVAIPLYQSYMRDSRIAVTKNTAASIGGMIVAGNQFKSAYPGDVSYMCNTASGFVQTIRNESNTVKAENIDIACSPDGDVTVKHAGADDACFSVSSDKGEVEECDASSTTP